PELPESLFQCRNTVGPILGSPMNQDTDPKASSGRLRDGGEWRGKEGDRPGEERTSTRHWSTSSARASTDGGIVRPRALAVLRLTINSITVGCSTGRSAGLAPLRILST